MAKKSPLGKCEEHAALIAELDYLSALAEVNKTLPGVSFTFEIEEDGRKFTQHHKNFNNRLPCILGFSQEELDLMGDDYLTKIVWKEDQDFAGEMFRCLSTGDNDASYNTFIRLRTFDDRMVRMFLLCCPSQRYPGGNLKQIRGMGLIMEDERYIRPKMYGCLSEDIKPEVLEMINNLSDREKDVLQCQLKGLSAKETADNLNISFNTVNSHVKQIREVFQLTHKGSLLGFALKNGLFSWLNARE